MYVLFIWQEKVDLNSIAQADINNNNNQTICLGTEQASSMSGWYDQGDGEHELHLKKEINFK